MFYNVELVTRFRNCKIPNLDFIWLTLIRFTQFYASVNASFI